MMTLKKTILITGASSGMGKATALQLIAEGHCVYGAARRPESMKKLVDKGGHAIGMDITDEKQVDAAIERVLREQGGIDVLVNNAGYAVYGSVEDVTIDEARRQFEVNLFGLAYLTQKVIPFMRENRAGQIINVTSVGGKIYSPLGSWYHATKHALEGWSDVLRIEMAQFDVKVTIIEPGAITTEFVNVMDEPLLVRSEGGAYETMAKMAVRSHKSIYDNSPAAQPEVIAKTIAKAISASNPKTRYAAGKMAKLTLFMRRWLSDKMFDKIILNVR